MILAVMVSAGITGLAGCDDDAESVSGPDQTAKGPDTGSVGLRACDTVSLADLEAIFSRPATFEDEGPLNCAWNVGKEIAVEYTALRPVPDAEQFFRDRRRDTTAETREIAGIGDEAFYQPPDSERPDSAALNVRDGDRIFIVSVLGSRASTLREELVELAEVVLQTNRPRPTYRS